MSALVLKTRKVERPKSLSSVLNQTFAKAHLDDNRRSITIACTPEAFKEHGTTWRSKVEASISTIAKSNGLNIEKWDAVKFKGRDALRVHFRQTLAAFSNVFQDDLFWALKEQLQENPNFTSVNAHLETLRVTGNEERGVINLVYSVDANNEPKVRSTIRSELKYLLGENFDKKPLPWSSPKVIGDGRYQMLVSYTDDE